ncbi:UTP-glucose-1-phosphate uridylyltransferase [Tieghemiomyces parasiticus]|uniref:UTP--glucose-1-phosphate uridylyltransferase n=1 Tax=Tieghemiomyces parasiticus TaxID=78921 RepID=A0A9W7ZQB3_9FUNG|nr:UTP-glucose-1-phosphate uridylyltransferase [Tieghemiomyces parasiticus]
MAPPPAEDWRTASSSPTAVAMRQELDRLVQQISSVDEKQTIQIEALPQHVPFLTTIQYFAKEMDGFYRLFVRFLEERYRKTKMDWNKIRSPAPEQVIPYRELSSTSLDQSSDLLSKLAVLKLNGGLGTTMGCVGPKSAIEVRDGMTFLDLTVHQIEHLNEVSGAQVPLILMNSFNTDRDTRKIVQKYNRHSLQLLTFNQSRYPRILNDSLMPVPNDPTDNTGGAWYPPGHGDLFEAFVNSGLVDQLLADGKEYVFISNVDNLGATVDPTILAHMASSGAEFLMEVTNKTKADIKGGTIIDYDGGVRLLEIAQVPSEHVDDFKSIKKFKIFNTNNLWVSLRAIKRVVESNELSMEIIVNHKSTDAGQKVIQLETAVGAAIKHFNKAHGINVPRSRFLPVKSTSDLFLITSDLYSLEKGQLSVNPKRMFQTVPLVKLGDDFKKVGNFLARFKTPPHILELDHLTVTGDVTFGADVVLQGTVIIVANHGNRIDIPSGAILNDKVVSGNLRILDH